MKWAGLILLCAITLATSAAAEAAEPAAGSLLVASRGLQDPNFTRSVVFILEYSDEGALGIVLNRPTSIDLSSVIRELESSPYGRDRLFAGGPVEINTLWIIVSGPSRPEPSRRIFGDVYLCTSLSALEGIVDSDGKSTALLRVYAGYTGWGPGQLDQEIARGDWHILKADRESVFSTSPLDLWNLLIERSASFWTMSLPNRY
jgi:putative transcriptional regulator